jgi:hypothetical protein
VTSPSTGTPGPDSPDRSPTSRGRWPEPTTPQGAILYAVAAGLIVWLLISVLSHVHVYWH